MKKKILFNILVFILPVFFVSILFLFFKNVVFISDLRGQYIGFFAKLQSILKGNGSIFYSFNSGLGANFLSDYYYYLSSPLNFLLIFFSKKTLLLGITLIILIKDGLASLTMSIYLKKSYSISNYASLLLSMCYALMSFFVSFYSNVMWLDAIVVMPLVLLGIEEFVDDGKSFKYIFFTFLLILSNYYISFMCILFSFIYFFSMIVLKKKNNKKTIFKFIIINVITALLCSFILIPTFINVLNLSKSRGLDYIELVTFKDRLRMLLSVFVQFFPFSSTTYNFSYAYLPNIYCSIFVLLICIKFYCDKKIPKTEKLLSLFIFSIFILSFLTNTGNYIFNGFSHPFGYYFRFSFLMSLYMVVLSGKYFEYNSISDLRFSIKQIIIVNIIFTILFIIAVCFSDNFNLFLLLFFLIYVNIYFYVLNIISVNSKTKIILFVLVLFELILNCYYSFGSIDYINNNTTYNNLYSTCSIDNSNNRYIYDNLIFRNSSLVCGTNGSAYSSSNINYGIKEFYQKIGAYVSGSYYYLSQDNTKLIKKLLSVQYEQREKSYSKINNSLSVGYMVNKDLSNLVEENPFEYQNLLISSMIGENIKPLNEYKVKDINIDEDSIKKTYYINNKNELYFYIWSNTKNHVFRINFAKIYIDGKLKTLNQYGIKKIKNNGLNEITIEIEKNRNKISEKHFKYYDITKNWLYYEDEDITDYAVSKLSKNQLKITKMEKNVLEGSISVDDNKILFLSIPYEEGWNIYVDGKKVNYFKIYDAFIGINLDRGYHNIRMNFYPKGLKLGLFVSIGTMIVLLLIKLVKIKFKA